MAIEQQFVTVDEHGTTYRVIPNPDCPPASQSGVYLEWKDGDAGTSMFIGPDVLADVAEMLRRMVADNGTVKGS